jgi:hypothetical protein
LNIDDLYHRDYLTITNKNNARGMSIGAKKINKASFRKNKNDNGIFHLFMSQTRELNQIIS